MLTVKLRAAFRLFARQTKALTVGSPTAGKRFKRCVLHIGTEKTGSSTIQRFLTLNRAALLGDGVIYPAATGKKGGGQWGFVAGVQSMPWKTDVGSELGIHSAIEQDAYKERLQSNLVAEFKAAPKADVLVISSEHLHSRLTDEEAISRLKGFLRPWVERFEIVLYLRRQDQVSLSLYSTQLKTGNSRPFAFPGVPNGQLPYYFDYEKIYANWAAVFGAAALRVRLFSPREWEQGDLLEDFCAVSGLNLQGKRIPIAENESLNEIGAEFLREVNRQLPAMIDGQRNKERDALAGIVSRLSMGRNYPATREDAMKFYRHFAASNERLKTQVFPGRAEPLFDEDFSDYPQQAGNLEPSYRDAVEMAIRIWKAKI